MKTILLFTALLSCCQLTFGQRQMNLSATIVSPPNGTYVQFDQQFTVGIEVENIGDEDLNAEDSLRISLTFNGSPVAFFIDGAPTMYMYRNGIPINAAQTFTHTFELIFNPTLIQDSLEVCYTIEPINGSDPIQEVDLTDNKSCVYLNVVEDISVVGIENISIETVTASPNPVHGQFQLSILPESSVSLVDLSGKEIRSYEANISIFDVHDVNEGVYFVRFDYGGVPQQVRVMIR